MAPSTVILPGTDEDAVDQSQALRVARRRDGTRLLERASVRTARLLPRLCVACFLLVTLASCGESAGTADPTATSTATSPEAGNATQRAPSEPEGDQTITPPAGLFLATPDPDQPITREQPESPAPTAPSAPPPTIGAELDADGDGFFTFEELEQAVMVLYPSYEWPDRYRLDPSTALLGFEQYRNQAPRFETGMQYAIFDTYHQCAWQLAWLDGFRAGDDALMTESLHQLRTVSLASPTLDPGAREYLDEVYRNAELGDPAMMQQIVTANCNPADFISATPAS
jgi:hypothetical protein